MDKKNCPYLGLIDNPRTFVDYPDSTNACHSIDPPVLLAFNYQRTTCLQVFHRKCPGYLFSWKDGVPKHVRQRRKDIIPPVLSEGLAWLILAIPVIFMLWMVFTGRLSFLAETFRPSTVSSPTVVAFFTQTPTAITTPTETIAPMTQLTDSIDPSPEPDEPPHTQPVATQTPLPPETPMISVSYKTNCRTGPGVRYTNIGGLFVGERAEVVGVSEDGEYWVIKNPLRPGECWLWGRFATVEGDISGLPKRTPPPR